MIRIIHNPRCSKSRQGVALLEDSGKEFTIVSYLKEPLTKQELVSILKKLEMEPLELVRKNESIWKENYKGKTLSETEIIEAMIESPKLIERPIVINNKKAIVGRPPENIKQIL